MTKHAVVKCAFLLALGSVGGVAAGAGSTTIVVPDDQPTIQAAVDAAHWGWTIDVKPGTYREHVVLDSNPAGVVTGAKDHITIVGRTGAVLESPDAGPGLRLHWTDTVVVSGLTLRSTGDAVVLDHCYLTTLREVAVDRAAVGVHVTGGYSVTVESCIVTGAGGTAIVSESPQGPISISSNVIVGGAAGGISVSGFASVDHNQISMCAGDAISTEGGWVEGNTIKGVGGDGVVAKDVPADQTGSGVSLTIANNTIGGPLASDAVGGSAIRVVSSSDVAVAGNQIAGAGGDGVHAEDARFCGFSSNQISRTRLDGLHVEGLDSTLLMNRVDHAGAAAVAVLGDRIVVDRNTITSSVGDGVLVLNDATRTGLSITSNKVTKPGADGIDLGAASNGTISGNVIVKARKNGIEIGAGTGNTLDANRSTTAKKFDLYEAGAATDNDVLPTNVFKKMNKRTRRELKHGL